MFKSLFSLVEDVVKIAVAPVEIAVDLVSIPVNLLAKEVKEVVTVVKGLKE